MDIYVDDFYSDDRDDVIIDRYRFHQTCFACPEQYDMFLDGTEILTGYVRLRHGNLSFEFPNVRGETLFFHKFSEPLGIFENEEERMKYLNIIVKTLKDAGSFWFNEKGQYHKDNGPAIILNSGTIIYAQNGLRHNSNGPAVEWKTGEKQWFYNGKEFEFKNWLEETNISDEEKLKLKLQFG